MKKFIISLSLVFVAAFSFVFFNTHDTKASTYPIENSLFPNYLIIGIQDEGFPYYSYDTYDVFLIVQDANTFCFWNCVGAYFGLYNNYRLYMFDFTTLGFIDPNTLSSAYFFFGLRTHVNGQNAFIYLETPESDDYAECFYSFADVSQSQGCSLYTQYNIFFYDSSLSLANYYYNLTDVYNLFTTYFTNRLPFITSSANSQYNQGYNSGFNTGYNQGYNSGYSLGGFEGFNNGEAHGYETAYNLYFESRYNLGYQAGYSAGSLNTENWLGDSLLSLVDIPFIVFKNIFNFELFGFNIYAVVFSLLTIGLVLFLIRKLLKKE